MTRALGRVKTRLYNGADNLTVYGLDKADRAMELSSLIAWASDDLSRREVAGHERFRSRVCPRYGSIMICYRGMWICPDYGTF